jgi:hypothetical protein
VPACLGNLAAIDRNLDAAKDAVDAADHVRYAA